MFWGAERPPTRWSLEAPDRKSGAVGCGLWGLNSTLTSSSSLRFRGFPIMQGRRGLQDVEMHSRQGTLQASSIFHGRCRGLVWPLTRT